MPRRCIKSSMARAAGAEPSFEQLPDLTKIEPDALRDKIHKALSILTPEEQALMRDRLLEGLLKAGVYLGSCLLVLGIPARTADDMTPLELAKIVRYLRLNQPEAIKAVAGALGELLAAARKPQDGIKKAA